MLALLTIPAAALAVLGGDPGHLVYHPTGDETLGDECGLAIAADGVLFAAFEREIGEDGDVVILRSANHGCSWWPWSTISGPLADDQVCHPRIAIASDGTDEWVIVSYLLRGAGSSDDAIWVCRAPAAQATPTWDSALVEGFPWSPGVFPQLGPPELAVRPAGGGLLTIAVAYWVWVDVREYVLHYSVSQDGGVSFSTPLAVAHPPAPADGIVSTEVEVGLGASGRVHLATLRTVSAATPESVQVTYYSGVNDGAASGDWSSPPTTLFAGDTGDHALLMLASDPGGDDVLIGYRRLSSPDDETFIQGSLDGGVPGRRAHLLIRKSATASSCSGPPWASWARRVTPPAVTRCVRSPTP